jgi:hypothetical protein
MTHSEKACARKGRGRGRVAALAAVAAMGIGIAAQAQRTLGYQDTPLLPGGKWHVHDGTRPQPKVVDPGTASTATTPGRAPSDAVVLFDGKDLSKWKTERGADAGWKVENGYMEVPPRGTQGGGTLATRNEFGDCQLHLEFASPAPKGEGQERGNSGIMFFGKYEFQVLDSYQNPTYPDGQAGAIYGQYPPLVNASRKPGEWQTYDILFTAPRFEGDKLVSPAYVTAFHNGVMVQNHAEVLGPVGHRVRPPYVAHGPKGPITLQDHSSPVRFRNIWVRELKGYDQP